MKLPLVQFENATIIQNKQTILSDVNIEVQEGDFTFLIGKTGTGKSSLIKTLYADLPLQSGTGRVSDFNLAEIKQREIPFLRRKLGVVFQDFKLLPDRSIFENLSFVLKATCLKASINILFIYFSHFWASRHSIRLLKVAIVIISSNSY